jgi:hypothetical protein
VSPLRCAIGLMVLSIVSRATGQKTIFVKGTTGDDGCGDPSDCRYTQCDLDGQRRLMGSTVDMGAYEFVGPPGKLGDLNCDCAVDVFDIDPFVLALTNPTGYAAAFQGCSVLLADCNGDGAVNAFDIDPFVLLLTGG